VAKAPHGEGRSDLQGHLLQGVSRTFALTIPRLPPKLYRAVANGYLLCRTVDTIEDEPELQPEEKRRFCERFAAVVAGQEAVHPFSEALRHKLSERTPPAERELIARLPEVIAITHSLSPADRRALERCVAIMARGMAAFQRRDLKGGLDRLEELDRYCYYVAGVVGEMLTDLFVNHIDGLREKYHDMRRLAISFGQGLQMTNILKDRWDDYGRGVVWLPREVFERYGFDLSSLSPGTMDDRFAAGIQELVAVAHGHLQNALRYTLMIPRRETGVRDFCFWAIGMALLTLKNIHRYPLFRSASEVKISRADVKRVVQLTALCHRSDWLLRGLFSWLARGLPEPKTCEIKIRSDDEHLFGFPHRN